MTHSQLQLLKEVERFLKLSGISPTAFGERVMGDGHLVRTLREGRSVTLKTADKIRDFIEAWSPDERSSVPNRPAA